MGPPQGTLSPVSPLAYRHFRVEGFAPAYGTIGHVTQGAPPPVSPPAYGTIGHVTQGTIGHVTSFDM